MLLSLLTTTTIIIIIIILLNSLYLNSICEHSQDDNEMNEVQIVSLKLLTPQKREEHSEIQKEYLSVNTSHVLGWRWQTFPGLQSFPNLDTL